jgi:hypothetical protein
MFTTKKITRLLEVRLQIRFLLWALLILQALQANGQKTTYLDMGGGFTYHVIKDDAMSPVRYKGLLPTLSFGILKEKRGKRLTELRLPVQYALLTSGQFKEYPSMKANMFRLDMDYVYVRQTNMIKNSVKGAFFLGASLHTFLDMRYLPQLDNSAILYDNFNSLAISAAYKRTFKLKHKQLTHYHRISMPLFSYGSRPDYLNIYDVTNPDDDLFKYAQRNARLCSFGSFWRIMMRHMLFYPIRGNNQLGISYEWQYYTASFTERIKGASHAILFSLLVNI